MLLKEYNDMCNFILILLLLTPISCIEETVTSNLQKDFETTALVLSEIELRGDYINSPAFPAIKNAEEVYMNLPSYILLDVRSVEEFNNGHIENAVNISNEKLFDYVINTQNTNKDIIIISNTGQSASYYVSLFRLYGLKNIFALHFGMASWHHDFDYLMSANLKNIATATNYDNVNINKPEISKLPNLILQENYSFNEFYKQQIQSLFNNGFDETAFEDKNSFNAIDATYLPRVINDDDSFIICFGSLPLYYDGKQGEPLNPGHPKGAVLYKILYPNSELNSIKYLQTLNSNKIIILYGFSGQLTSMAVAHLRLLGYDAKSVLFGAHSMFYGRLSLISLLSEFVYKRSQVKNLPYVK